jgi:hypothetical protein
MGIMGKKEDKKATPAPEQPMGVDKRNEAAVSTGLVVDMAMIMEDEGVGRETMTAKDLAIPRLGVLQALSPVCTKGDPAYVKEAEVGEIFDNIEGKRFDGEQGIIVIPVTYRRAYIEWDNRKFVADHGTDDSILRQCTLNEKKQMELPNGNTISETAEYYVIFIEPGTGLPKQAVISMTRTMFKTAKQWNSMMSNLMVPRPDGKGAFNPAIYYQSYKLTTIPQTNDQGSWYVWKVQAYKPTIELEGGSDLYLGSRAFRKNVVDGEVRVANDDVTTSDDSIIDGDSI